MTRLALAMAAALLLSAPCTPSYAAAAAAGISGPATPALRKPPSNNPPPLCAPLPVHADYLARRWGERPFAPGRIGGSVVVILFVNPAKRTWTLIRVMNGAIGCAIGAGRLPPTTDDKAPSSADEL